MTAPGDFCRACGHLADEPPWGAEGDAPTYDICECCGVEFGYGDTFLGAIRGHRSKWLEAGAKWSNPRISTDGLDPATRLLNVPAQFR